jgi:hypothetical protein
MSALPSSLEQFESVSMWRDGHNGKASAVTGWQSCPLSETLIQHRHEPIRSDRLRVARYRVLLPNKLRGVPRVDDRRFLHSILWLLRSGAPWRDPPERYGARTTGCNRFVRWRKAGVWTPSPSRTTATSR